MNDKIKEAYEKGKQDERERIYQELSKALSPLLSSSEVTYYKTKEENEGVFKTFLKIFW